MTTDPFSTVASELPRDRWGRPLITPPDGGDPAAYTRVTTFAKAIDDTYHLTQWAKRMVVLGMAQRRDLVLAATAITDPDDRQQKRLLNDLAEKAIEASKAGAKAIAGTALHSFTEVLDEGKPLPDYTPEEYVPTLVAYSQAVRFFKVLKMEGFCVVDSLRIGGSYDRILEATAEGLDLFEEVTGRRMCYPDGTEVVPGDVFIGDLKTGKSIDFGIGAIAVQLAAYANGEDYDHTLGERTPLVGNPSRKWALVIHAPAGKGDASLVWVDVEAGWQTAAEVLPHVHSWRKRKDLHYPFHMERAEAADVGPNLVEQINAATSPEALRDLYSANASRWTPGLTSLATERIKALSA